MFKRGTIDWFVVVALSAAFHAESACSNGFEIDTIKSSGTYYASYCVSMGAARRGDRTYITYMEHSSYDVWLTYYSHSTGTVATPVEIASLSGYNDHNSGSVAVDSSGYIYLVGGGHVRSGKPVRLVRSSNPNDISSWESPVTVETEWGSAYSVLICDKHNRIHMVYRRGANDQPSAELMYKTYDSVNGLKNGPNNGLLVQGSYNNVPYFPKLGYDHETDVVYLVWCYAHYASSGVNRTGAGSFAYSDDGGQIWKKGDGTDYNLPITSSTRDMFHGDAGRGRRCIITVRENGDFFISSLNTETSDLRYFCSYYDGGWENVCVDSKGWGTIGHAGDELFAFYACADTLFSSTSNDGINWSTRESIFVTPDYQVTAYMTGSRGTDSTAVELVFNTKISSGSQEARVLLGRKNLTGVSESAVSVTPSHGFTISASPNPFTTRSEVSFYLSGSDFRFSSPADGGAGLRIYDLGGRLVRSLQITRSPQPEADPPQAENHQITKSWWDGTDNDGRSVEPGIYFCSLQTGTLRHTHKLILLK